MSKNRISARPYGVAGAVGVALAGFLGLLLWKGRPQVQVTPAFEGVIQKVEIKAVTPEEAAH